MMAVGCSRIAFKPHECNTDHPGSSVPEGTMVRFPDKLCTEAESIMALSYFAIMVYAVGILALWVSPELFGIFL